MEFAHSRTTIETSFLLVVSGGRLADALRWSPIAHSLRFAGPLEAVEHLELEVFEIHFTPWAEFQAVDFLEVEAIEGFCWADSWTSFRPIDAKHLCVIFFLVTLTHGSQRHH